MRGIQAVLLNSGSTSIVYNYTNETVATNINQKTIFTFGISIGSVFVIAFIYFIIRFKAKGFIAIYFQIGFLATLLLILRLTSVTITIEGITGIIISMVLEYIFTFITLENIEKRIDGMYKKSNLIFFLNTFPIYVVAVIFTFASKAYINSFGTTLFWGILMIYIYNFIFSKYVFENLKIGGHDENI